MFYVFYVFYVFYLQPKSTTVMSVMTSILEFREIKYKNVGCLR